VSLKLASERRFRFLLLPSRGVSDDQESIRSEQLRRPHTLAESVRAKSVEERFRELAATWRQDRGPSSLMHRLTMHVAYQQIIGMGAGVVPCILKELEARPDWWFWALTAITGVDPVPPDHNGKLRLMAQDWLRWARDNGFTW